MTTLNGIGVNPGRIIEPVLHVKQNIGEPEDVKRSELISADVAVQALRDAITSVTTDLKTRADQAAADGKEEARDILKATAQIAADPTLSKEAISLIENENYVAARAIWVAAAKIAEQFKAIGGYMAERVSDIEDVRLRIVAMLLNQDMPGIPDSSTPFILLAEDLAPADTATIDPKVVKGIITEGGGPQSHTAIIARNLGIPAIVAAVDATEIEENTETYMDGSTGFIGYPASEADRQRAAAWQKAAENMKPFKGDCTLADGYKMPLRANIGTVEDAQAAAAVNAQGVGLLRTEFLFLDRSKEPSLEEQVQQYNDIFELFPGEKIIVRTLDAGADKPLPFLNEGKETNPALGIRGFRTHLNFPEVLERQLESISQAQKLVAKKQDNPAEIWVMAPMIATTEEADSFAHMCEKADLACPGIMIEVPSAAINSENLLSHAKFSSLGTNDLTQYTLAADRELSALAPLNDPWQPGVLKLIELAVKGTHAAQEKTKEDRSMSVCGEAAADPALATVLVGLGVSSLSMTPRAFDTVNAVLSSVTQEQAQELAQVALSAPTAQDAKDTVRKQLPILEELGL